MNVTMNNFQENNLPKNNSTQKCFRLIDNLKPHWFNLRLFKHESFGEVSESIQRLGEDLRAEIRILPGSPRSSQEGAGESEHGTVAHPCQAKCWVLHGPGRGTELEKGNEF